MKKLSIAIASLAALVSVPAIAADMAVKARPIPVVAPAPYNWTGFYIGFSSGGSIADVSWTDTLGAFPGSPDHIASGGLVGGTIGFNFQVASWVWGIEADASWASIRGSANCGIGPVLPSLFRCHTEMDFFGTVRGRLGYAVGPMLFYATGGGAWANIEHELRFLPTQAFFVRDDSPFGWTAGVGFEYAPFKSNLTWKIEWLYYEFERERFFGGLPGVFAGADADIKLQGHLIRTGLNYRFNWASPAPAVVARY
jgi:outer membrane immunogenic protein